MLCLPLVAQAEGYLVALFVGRIATSFRNGLMLRLATLFVICCHLHHRQCRTDSTDGEVNENGKIE
jgi:hypothetical protein